MPQGRCGNSSIRLFEPPRRFLILRDLRFSVMSANAAIAPITSPCAFFIGAKLDEDRDARAIRPLDGNFHVLNVCAGTQNLHYRTMCVLQQGAIGQPQLCRAAVLLHPALWFSSPNLHGATVVLLKHLHSDRMRIQPSALKRTRSDRPPRFGASQLRYASGRQCPCWNPSTRLLRLSASRIA